MTTSTLSDKDRMLVQALDNAVKGLTAAKLKDGTEDRDIREILFDISCEALQPLPASIRVYLPEATKRISSQEQLDVLIAELGRLGGALVH